MFKVLYNFFSVFDIVYQNIDVVSVFVSCCIARRGLGCGKYKYSSYKSFRSLPTVVFISSISNTARYCFAREGGTPHMKGVGMLVGNFEETDLGVAHAFF